MQQALTTSPTSTTTPIVNSLSSSQSPSLVQRASEVSTSVSEVNARKYSTLDKNAIIQAVKKYNCTAEFPDNAAAKILGPSSNLIQAIKNCGNSEFAKGPFTLNFNIKDMTDTDAIQKIEQKINKLLSEASNPPKTSIMTITINGQEDKNLCQPTRDKPDGSIQKISINTDSSQQEEDMEIHKKPSGPSGKS